MEDEDRIVEFCRAELGPELRSILGYTTEGTEVIPAVLYVRDDVAAEYDDFEAFAEEVMRDFALETVSKGRFEELSRFGELHAVLRVFEEAVVVRFAEEESRGVSVAVDAHTDVALHRFARRWADRFGDPGRN